MQPTRIVGVLVQTLEKAVPRRNARDDQTGVGEGSFQGAAL
jgi:hypothetical protein